MQSILNEPANAPMPDETWNQIAPLLDGAMEQLGKKDHDAVVLRFFENKTFAEVGATLGASEDAAKMRVSRALEKLRKFFAKRGVSSTTAILAGAIAANSVQAAPVALAKSVTAAAIAKGAAASGSTLTLIKGALKIMAWTKVKTAIVTAASVLLVSSVTTIVAVKAIYGEPSYGGKTVTAWLDQLVLYENRPVPGGTEEVLRVENTLDDPSVRALLNLGPKAVPTLTKRLLDIPEPSPAVWKISFKRRPVPTTYPEFQRARKTAAGFALVALGKNDGGGYISFMETYARAPKINVTGPPVGVVPSTVMVLAKAIFPERRQEFIDDIFKGLEHTNAVCRQMSMECARKFPDELVKHRELLVRLTQDEDEFVQQATLGALILIVQNNPAPNLMPPSEIERIAEDVLQNPQTTARTREYANTLLKLAEAQAAK